MILSKILVNLLIIFVSQLPLLKLQVPHFGDCHEDLLIIQILPQLTQ